MIEQQFATGVRNLPKCFGAAKNFSTNAKKNDPNMALPKYPLIFSKSLACVKPHGKPFPVPWHAEDD